VDHELETLRAYQLHCIFLSHFLFSFPTDFLFLLQCSNAGSHVAPNLCVHLFIGVTQPALVGLRSGFVHAKGQEKIYYRITILITLQLVTVTKYTKSLSTVTISFLKFHTQTFFYFNCILQ